MCCTPSAVLPLRVLLYLRSSTSRVCGSSVFSMIGFAGGTPGVVGAICGILACVASSILMCCAPKTTEEGGGKFTAVRCLTISPGG